MLHLLAFYKFSLEKNSFHFKNRDLDLVKGLDHVIFTNLDLGFRSQVDLNIGPRSFFSDLEQLCLSLLLNLAIKRGRAVQLKADIHGWRGFGLVRTSSEREGRGSRISKLCRHH